MSPRLASFVLLAFTDCGPHDQQTATPADAGAAPKVGDTEPGTSGPPAPRHSLAPWMRDLFDDSRTLVYEWDYEVDVHDVEGSVATAAGTLTCAMQAPITYALDGGGVALGTCRTCEFEASKDQPESADFNPTLAECYVGTPNGLWITDALPGQDDEALAELLSQPPYLAKDPVEQVVERDGETPGLRIDATVVKHGGQEMNAWCRVDELVEIYDPMTARCFVPGLGLQEVVMGGRSGPSFEGYSLVPAGS